VNFQTPAIRTVLTPDEIKQKAVGFVGAGPSGSIFGGGFNLSKNSLHGFKK